jgi:ATP-independent RNA helicase DbpA
LLFSATYPDAIRKISRSFQRNPVTVTVEQEHEPGVIEQMFYEVKTHERNNTLLALFEHYQPESALVFCHTKKQCDEVAEFLDASRIQCLAIHGDLEQRERDEVLVSSPATACYGAGGDRRGRAGLDVKSLQAAINRIATRKSMCTASARTGRAGKKAWP